MWALAEALPFLRRLSVSHCRGLVEVAAFSGRHGDGVTGVVTGGGEEVQELCNGVGALVVAAEPEGVEEADGVDGEEGPSGPGRTAAAAAAAAAAAVVGVAGDETEDGGDDDEEEEMEEGEGVEKEEEVVGDDDVAEEASPPDDTAESAGAGAGRGGVDGLAGCGDARAGPAPGGGEKKGRRRGGEGKGRRARNSSGSPRDEEEQQQQQQRGQGDAHGRANGGKQSERGGRRRRKSSVGTAGDCSEAEEAGGDGGGVDDDGRSAESKDGASGGGKGRRRKAGAAGGKRGDKVSRKEARAAAKKKSPVEEDGGGGGGGRRGRDDALDGEEDCGKDGEDACQGLEFRVDGKTRVKLERLAAALPRCGDSTIEPERGVLLGGEILVRCMRVHVHVLRVSLLSTYQYPTIPTTNHNNWFLLVSTQPQFSFFRLCSVFVLRLALAGLVHREPGRKKAGAGRPSCIRFLQDKCPRSAAECAWAHLPMHVRVSLKYIVGLFGTQTCLCCV